MSSQYQAPLTPGFGSGALNSITSGNLATTRSPFFSVSNQFLPRNLHDVIRWARYITTQSPVTTEVIRKLSTYPITDFNIDTEKESTKARYKEIFKSFGLRSVLHDVGFDYYTIGNVFVSIYFPIHRTLVCSSCSSEFNAKKLENVKFVNFGFEGQCSSCGSNTRFTHKDTKSFNIEDMNLIKWDPVNIAVNHNPITNEYEYYYKIPNEIRRKVKQGDRLFVDSVPWEFIEAIRNNQDFKFDSGNIFHLKNLSTGQMVEGVGVPPLISLFSLVFYQATLRRANESVAQDYMAPMRVIYPSAQTGNSDPVISLSMSNFAANMQGAIQKHKQDNNHIVIAPVPIGYQAISGEGKTLLVSQEIAQAEESILLSLGVSRELLSGTTNWTSSTVGLRMLENTLSTYTAQMDLLIEWIMTRISRYLSIEACPVTLTPFKLSDDDNFRQVIEGLVSTGKASVSTLLETYGVDYDDELTKIREDAVAEAINQARTQLEVDRGVFLAAKQIEDKFDQDNSYKTALTKAQAIAEQIHGADMSIKRQVLNQLRVEDFAMYLMVSKLLQEYSESDVAQSQTDMVMQGPEVAGESQGEVGGDPKSKPGSTAGTPGSKPATEKPEPKSESKPTNIPKKEK